MRTISAGGGRTAEVVAHHLAAHAWRGRPARRRSPSTARRGVSRDSRASGNGELPSWPDQQGRDALRHLRDGIWIGVEAVGGVVVRVDHAGREHQSGGIDHAIVRRGVTAPISTMVSPPMRRSARRSGAPVPSAISRAADRPARRRRQHRHQAGGDAIDHAPGIGLREVGDRDDRDVVADA